MGGPLADSRGHPRTSKGAHPRAGAGRRRTASPRNPSPRRYWSGVTGRGSGAASRECPLPPAAGRARSSACVPRSTRCRSCACRISTDSSRRRDREARPSVSLLGQGRVWLPQSPMSMSTLVRSPGPLSAVGLQTRFRGVATCRLPSRSSTRRVPLPPVLHCPHRSERGCSGLVGRQRVAPGDRPHRRGHRDRRSRPL